ncbi:MAG: phosphoribosylformylglycinamidine synthase subunit PurQ [Spirochaetaceae bacterium]|nr:MAG: phosphoribosylformylglycinamidine synthase subunit PurQ [Spirochaetaceae bacterium]
MSRLKPLVCVLSGNGINADRELARAFGYVGADARHEHVQDVFRNPALLDRYSILAFPGGFSYGDHLGSGQVLAALFAHGSESAIERFVESGKLVLGVCNGFQVLTKLGALPNLGGGRHRQASLVHNSGGTFVDAWVTIKTNDSNPSPWLTGLGEFDVPIRHGEGRFVAPELIDRIVGENHVAFTYTGGNPNGSERNIAGITDPTGRILGMMPHPEAFLYRENHPRWSRETLARENALEIFRNAVNYSGVI